ncbi:MAG: secretin N-terminal domain-containing protein, partial [Pseudomonadota bacterium]
MRVLLILLLLLPTHTLAQEETFTINLRDADITLLTEQVAEITGRTLVVHPDLAGDITVVSAEPLDAEGAWELYQSIIGLRGFVAVESGAIWQVVPQETARTATQIAEGTPGSQDIVTRLIRLERLPAEEAVRVLRPLVAAIGAIEPLADPNAVVVTDRRENVEKMTEIATRLDADTGEITEVITFDFAEASVVGTAIAEILGPSSAGTRLSVDPTSNSLIARGSPEDIAELLNLARSLDVAPKPNPQVALKTEVFRLNYGDATLIADLVRNTLSRTAAVTNPVAASLATDGAQNLTARRGAPPPVPEVSVQPSTEINAVVARGTDAQLVEVRGLIQRLDQRRAQVMIEAAIVEVSGEAAERLSVQLGFDQFTPQTGLAATSFGNNGTALSSVLTALGVPGASLLAGGGTLTIGRNNTFGLLLQALNQTSSAN